MLGWIRNALVVIVDNLFSVIHATVADLDGITIKEHKLRKIFNRNTIKISYSCMNNTKQIIDNHNKRIY